MLRFCVPAESILRRVVGLLSVRTSDENHALSTNCVQQVVQWGTLVPRSDPAFQRH